MSEKHSVIIMGHNKVQTWRFNHRRSYYNSFEVQLDYREDEVKVWEGVINKPQLEVGDKLYIEEIEKYITVQEVIRTTSDKIIYKSNYEASKSISKTLEQDRLEVIEQWMNLNGYHCFTELNYFNPKSIEERELKHKQDNQKRYKWKDKYKDIKEILKMKYK